MGSFLEIYRNRNDLEPTNEERHFINEVIEYIERKYNSKSLFTFRVFKPLTDEWKRDLDCQWGSNVPCCDIILLTRCRNEKAFYEVVFHELYEWLTDKSHDEIISEGRKYIEKRFNIKLGDREWSPLEDEMIQKLYCPEKKCLENTLAHQTDSGRFNRTSQEIQQRAKELGLIQDKTA